MGWESFRSEWDEPVDPPPTSSSGKKQKAKKAKNWWEEFHDDDLTGFDTDYDTSRYSYKDAFDDSNESWYRRSSFKYSRYDDYSPSRLFRSSFVGFRGIYDGDNDVKNKAIRALRTLTRNANTVVDAAKKISYDVQFSAGADSNGACNDLSSAKKQTIFVSPDRLVATKDADQEDAVIDALTGFVLLRVQISQTIPTETIKEINAVSVGALPLRLAEAVYTAGDTKNTAAEITANFMDGYLSSMLAKSMLTRLCRRGVIADWGGFAPYFVRHAKQYAETGEKLKALAPSVEGYVGKIAYNMIADETEITLEAEIETIVNKHLGSELEHGQILLACANLIAELRQLFADKGENPAGDIETAIYNELKDMIDAQKDAAKNATDKEKAVRSGMQDVADLFDSLYESDKTGPGLTEGADNLSEAANKFRDLRQHDKAVTALKNVAKELQAGLYAERNEMEMSYTQMQLNRLLGHFDAALAELKKAGVDTDLLDQSKYAGKINEEKLTAQIADINEFVNQARKNIKEALSKLRKELAESTKSTIDKLPEWREKLQKLLEQTTGVAETLDKTVNDHGCSVLKPVVGALNASTLSLENKIGAIDSMKEMLENDKAPARNAISSWQSFCKNTARSLYNDELEDLKSTINAALYGTFDQATKDFVLAALTHYNEHENDEEATKVNEWHRTAINKFVNRKQLTKNGFTSTAMKKAHEQLFENLRKQFADEEGHGSLPRGMPGFNELSPRYKEQFENLANSLGMSIEQLMDMLADMNSAEAAQFDRSGAEKIGDIVRETLMKNLQEFSPVDEQLFGQPVEKLTAILDGKSLSQVNDEARNAVEEEYIAYINNSLHEAKPKTRVIPPYMNRVQAAAVSKAIRNKRKAAIERIRNALCFQGTKRTGEVYGTLSGDLDEGGLHKLQYDCEHIWSQKQVVKLPDVAVGILVDQSGSMMGLKIEQAREMCIMLAEAVKKIEGIHLHIYGHSANMADRMDLTMFEHYSSYGSANNANLDMLGAIEAHSNNYDGYAIKEAAKMLDKDPASRKYLFVISDGLPHGNGYAGADARKHVTSVCSFVRDRLKIPTYAFAVGVSNSDKRFFEEQYGKDKVVFLSTVHKCLPQIVRFLHNAIQKEKKLVNVEVD